MMDTEEEVLINEIFALQEENEALRRGYRLLLAVLHKYIKTYGYKNVQRSERKPAGEVFQSGKSKMPAYSGGKTQRLGETG